MPISLNTIPRIWNPHRGIQNPRLSLNKLYMGREIEEKRRYFYENVTCRGTEKDAGRGTEVMEIEYFSSFAIFVTVLLSLVAIIAVPGNGLVLGIIVRFKKLRTFPNILIGNLALIDFFNALMNVPMYILWLVVDVKWFTGKTLAIMSLFLCHLFILLNIVSTLVLLGNAFMAIELDVKYFTWKTTEKAMTIVMVVWVVCLFGTGLLTWLHWDMDLQDAPLSKYRIAFSLKSQGCLTAIMASFIVTSIVFGVLAFQSIQRKKRQVRLKPSFFQEKKKEFLYSPYFAHGNYFGFIVIFTG